MVEVSIILPVYNEATCIQETMEAVRQFAAAHPRYQFVFVNDGSVDGCDVMLSNFMEQGAAGQIQLVSYHPNRGKGHAIREGLRVCEGKYVGFIDSDMAYPLSHLDKLVEPLKDHDIVIGSRLMVPSAWGTRRRRMLSYGYNLICRMTLGLPYRDMQAGLKGFRREVAEELFGRLLTQRYAFDAELLYLGKKRGYSIREIPAVVCGTHHSKKSSVNVLLVSCEMLANIVTIWWSSMRGRYD